MDEVAFLTVHLLHSCGTTHMMLPDEGDDSLLGDDWFIVLFPE